MRNRRREFSAETKRQARQRSNGICECGRLPGRPKIGCGRPLGAGNTFYEHITPDGIGGKPTLENCAVLTKTCWAKKSPDDITVVAKASGRTALRGRMKMATLSLASIKAVEALAVTAPAR